MTCFDRLGFELVTFSTLVCLLACNNDPPAPAEMPPPPAPGALADPGQPAQAPAAAAAAPIAPTPTPAPMAPSEPPPSAAVVHEPPAATASVEVERDKAAAAPSKPSANAKIDTKEHAKPAATRPATPKPAEPAASTKPAPPAPAAAPPAPTSSAPAAAVGKVTVPHTDHVQIDVPKGLQHWLDADTRMQPWVTKVVSIADACYADERKDNPKAAGVITVKVTMHENERPDVDVASVPSQLGGVIACATTKLMRGRPPLFTGKEGDSYTVKIHFDK
jgi:hypothetical protein